MKKIVLAAACAAAGLAANAKTVAWYRFDDAPVGTKANAQSAFLNAVDPAKYPGYFRTWAQDSRVHPENYPPVITDGESVYYPSYASGFRENVKFLDPVTQEIYGNTSVLELTNVSAASASSAGAILCIDDHDDFHLKTFTLEFYMKMSPEATGNAYRFIAQKFVNDGKTAMINIYMQGGAYLCCDLYTSTTDANSGEKAWSRATSQNTAAVRINDGCWHRVSISVDDETKSGMFSTDATVKTFTYTGEIDYEGAGGLYFGAPANTYYGSWPGAIDEIRISDKALAKDQLLVPFARPTTAEPAAVTSDTLLFIDFEGGEEVVTYDEFASGVRPTGIAEELRNKAPWNPEFHLDSALNYVTSAAYPMPAEGQETAWPTNDVPGTGIRAGLAANEFAMNATAYHFGTNAAACGTVTAIPRLEVADVNRYLVSDSFTAEFYLKMAPGDIEFRHTGQRGYIMMQSGAFTIYCNSYGRIEVSCVNGSFHFMHSYNGDSNTFECYNDGKWHHLALVYDKEASLGLFYIDGEYRAYLENAVFSSNPGGNDTKNLCIMGGLWGADMRFCDAAIDDIRFTRGVLRPYQFLTTRAIEGVNLGYAAFDGDYVISPYADLFKAATVSDAAFVTERPARIILDGKDGEPIRERNTRSVALSGGSVTWPEHDIVTDSEKVTAEFFVKTQTAGAPLLAVGDIWSLDSSLTLAVGAESAAPESAAGLADGTWHHVAVVFDGATAKVYLDYEVALEHVFASAPATAKAADLVLGGEGFTGNLDELRFTPSVLVPAQFLWAERSGMLLLLR